MKFFLFFILCFLGFFVLGCESDTTTGPVEGEEDTITLFYEGRDSRVVLPNGEEVAIRNFHIENPRVSEQVPGVKNLVVDFSSENSDVAPKRTIENNTDLSDGDLPFGVPIGDFFFRIGAEIHPLGDCIQSDNAAHINISIAHRFQPAKTGTIANVHLAVWKNPKGEICFAYLITGNRFPSRPCDFICLPGPLDPNKMKVAVTEGLAYIAEIMEQAGIETANMFEEITPATATVLGVMAFFFLSAALN